jgi:Xaa-Pro dipeptidase
MLSRRAFLWASTAAAALANTPRAFAQRGQQTPGTLPPAIQALTSMRGQAKPITADERRGRIERARTLMARQKMDALMLCSGTSLVYFTNIRWSGGERLFACIVPVKGDPFFVCPAFEEDRAREQIELGPFGGGKADVRTWHEHENPYDLVTQGLRDRGIATGRLGMEETVKFVFSDGVAASARGLEVVSGTPVTAGCRGVKDAHELELMQLANTVTLKAYEAAWKSLADGMTQNEFSGLISAAHARLGFSGGASVQVGPYSALPHGSIQPQTVRAGTIVLIDGGCAVEGYQSDISRTFVLGTPTDKMKRVFDVERKAQDAALAAAKPGVPCEAVDAAARKVIVDAGFGPDYKFFTHRVGHGIGMDGHEWPYLVRGNTLPLAPGMTFSDEPGIYIPGEFGVRLEDDMYITADGAKLFTPQSASLEKPF